MDNRRPHEFDGAGLVVLVFGVVIVGGLGCLLWLLATLASGLPS